MTDSAGELKVGVIVEIDEQQIVQQNEKAAEAAETVWAQAAEAIEQRLEQAQESVADAVTEAVDAVAAAESEVEAEVVVEVDQASLDSSVTETETAFKKAADVVERRQSEVATQAGAAQTGAAKQSENAWREAAKEIGKALLAAFTVDKIREFTTAIYDSALAIDRQARSLGVSTDEIQRMRYIAEQAGLAGNDLGEAMGALAQKAASAAADGGAAADMFRNLDFAFRDVNGAALPANELLAEAADVLARIPAGTERTAAAIQIFGEKGRLLLPVLERGRDGLQQLGAEFDELGGGLDQDTIASIAETEREFGRLKLTVTGAVLPALQGLVDLARRTSEQVRRFKAALGEASPEGNRARLAIAGLTTALGYLAVAYGVAKSAAIRAALESARAWAVAAWPVALVVGLIGASVLAYDDLITTLNGGDSVTRRFLDNLLGVERAQAVIDGVNERIENLGASVELLVAGAKLMGANIEAFGKAAYDALGPLQPVVDGIAKAFDAIVSNLDRMIPMLLQTFGGPLGQFLVQASSAPAGATRAERDRLDAARRGVNIASAGGVAPVQDVLQGTGAALQATPTQAFRFDQNPGGPGGAVTATARAQVNINGLVDADSNAFTSKVEKVVGDVLGRANDQALATVAKSSGRRRRA